MAGTHILAHLKIVGQRQHTAGRNDHTVPNHNGTVMQGRTLIEDRSQHFGDHIGVHRRAGADDLVQIVVALKHHKGARAGVRKLLCRIADRNDSALPCTAQRGVAAPIAEHQVGPHRALAHPLQRAAQLRLKDDHRSHKADGNDIVQRPCDGLEVQHNSQTVEHQNQKDALDKLARTGFAGELQKLVKHKRYDQDVQRVGQRVKGAQTA